MKVFPLAVLTAFIMSCGNSSPKEQIAVPGKNDLARYGYHGPVKQIVMKKYMNYTGELDSANFNFRTLYDYDKIGNVHFMQFVMNRVMFNEESIAVNYLYESNNGLKTGWTEIRLNGGDTSKGFIEWTDPTHIHEKKFISGTEQIAYEILTEIDSVSFIEKQAEIIQYADTMIVADQLISNFTDEKGDPLYRIYDDKTSGTFDTTYVEILKKDEHGNATELIERSGSNGNQTLIIKEFKYY